MEVKSQYYKSSVGSLHLNNKKDKRELKVNHNNETLPFFSEPRYLGGMFDRSLTYPRQLESLRKKLTSCAELLWRLADSGWDAGATTLRTATLPWFIQHHITALLSGTAMLTPASLTLPPTTPCELRLNSCVLHQRVVFLQRTERRHNGATVSLARFPNRALTSAHSEFTCPSSGNARPLKLRHPFQTRCLTTHQFTWRQKQKWMECRQVGVHYVTRYFPP